MYINPIDFSIKETIKIYIEKFVKNNNSKMNL